MFLPRNGSGHCRHTDALSAALGREPPGTAFIEAPTGSPSGMRLSDAEA